jgi:NAD+ synthase
VSRKLRVVPEAAAAEPDLALDPKATAAILEGFIRSEVERTGRKGVVLGLSGGIDSALAACLAVRALGPDDVHAVVMPYRTSQPRSRRDAEAIAKLLHLAPEVVDITPIVDGFREAAGDPGSARLGNVMARARMIVLYDRSQARGALVLGTSNKTELLLGYGTLHGDMASALNPLGDLYKTQVRDLSRALGVPRSILLKPPSADLWPDQTDEGELGFSYDEVDRVLAFLVDARMSPRSIVAAGFSRALVDRVGKLVVRSQFKRRLPLIAKVSTRSIGWDFRYPRDWKS